MIKFITATSLVLLTNIAYADTYNPFTSTMLHDATITAATAEVATVASTLPIIGEDIKESIDTKMKVNKDDTAYKVGAGLAIAAGVVFGVVASKRNSLKLEEELNTTKEELNTTKEQLAAQARRNANDDERRRNAAILAKAQKELKEDLADQGLVQKQPYTDIKQFED